MPYIMRDIKSDNPSEAELKEWYLASGLPLKRFFNPNGRQYKVLALKDKLPDMSEDEQLALLVTDGMLIKRLIFVKKGFVLVGFKSALGEKALHCPGKC